MPLLKTQTSWNGAPLASVQMQHPEVQALTIEIAPGGSTAWHQHPVPSYGYVLTGRLRVELEDKTFHEFKAGDALVEVVGTWHRGLNPGAEPLKLVVFYQAEVGTTLTIPRDKPQTADH